MVEGDSLAGAQYSGPETSGSVGCSDEVFGHFFGAGIAAFGHFTRAQGRVLVSPRDGVPRISGSTVPQRPQAGAGNDDVGGGGVYEGAHGGRVADGGEDVGGALHVYCVRGGPGVGGALPEADRGCHVEYDGGRRRGGAGEAVGEGGAEGGGGGDVGGYEGDCGVGEEVRWRGREV